ncbi:MAG: PepSY domain-containing protein [Burkholderiales bacterium]|nr:peptidase M4 [Ferrovum sp.]
MKSKFYLTTAAVLCAAVMSSAYAEKSMEKDSLSIDDTKVSMAQAVTTAEQYVGGKAVHAEYEHHKDRSTFDVEVVKDKKIIKVKIDPTSGKVLSSFEDKDDEHHKAY